MLFSSFNRLVWKKKNKTLVYGSFKGEFIPDWLCECKETSAEEKLVWARIAKLTQNQYGKCFASNEHLAKSTGLSLRTLERRISSLIKRGLIKCEYAHVKMKTVRTIEIALKNYEPANSGGLEAANGGGQR
jgi:hypothetical protein